MIAVLSPILLLLKVAGVYWRAWRPLILTDHAHSSRNLIVGVEPLIMLAVYSKHLQNKTDKQKKSTQGSLCSEPCLTASEKVL